MKFSTKKKFLIDVKNDVIIDEKRQKWRHRDVKYRLTLNGYISARNYRRDFIQGILERKLPVDYDRMGFNIVR